MTSSRRFERSLSIAASPEELWPLVAQTERLNREMGLPPIRFTFEPRQDGGAEARAEMRIAGLTLCYREHPFEWVKPEWYSFRRTFFGGPLREIRGGVALVSRKSGTDVTTWAEIETGVAAGQALAPLIAKKALADFVSAVRGFGRFLSGDIYTPYPSHVKRSPANSGRLSKGIEALLAAGVRDRIAHLLAEHIRSAPPEDLRQMRPYVLADMWAVERREALRAMLLGASREAGLLNLHWRVLCPSCRGSRTNLALSELASEAHCESCNIHFESAFDKNVEVVFTISRAVRAVSENTFCVGGPELTPHIAAQWVLAPGEERQASLPGPAGDLRLFSPQAEGAVEALGTLNDTLEIHVRPAKVGGRASLAASVRKLNRPSTSEHSDPGCLGLVLHNSTRVPVVVRAERMGWSSQVATAAEVTTLQEFRDRFSSEVLSAGAEMAIEQVCILFSDLKGSTRLYGEIGDAPSYRLVRDHFEWMSSLLSRHGGAIVKTIGDAVMAVFHDPADGLSAALAIQQEHAQRPGEPLVKLGLHWGPAIAVTANGRLDYFGQTVNLAARLQTESAGGDVVLVEALAADPRIAQLTTTDVATERFTARPRGFEEEVPMLRLHPMRVRPAVSLAPEPRRHPPAAKLR